jgi:hypothetical protein
MYRWYGCSLGHDAGNSSIERLFFLKKNRSIAADAHGKDGMGWARLDLHALSRWQISVNKPNNEGNSSYRFTFKWQSCGKPSAAPPEVLCLLCLFCSVVWLQRSLQHSHLVWLHLMAFSSGKPKKAQTNTPLDGSIVFICCSDFYQDIFDGPTHFGTKSGLLWTICVGPRTSLGLCPPLLSVWVGRSPSGPTHLATKAIFLVNLYFIKILVK